MTRRWESACSVETFLLGVFFASLRLCARYGLAKTSRKGAKTQRKAKEFNGAESALLRNQCGGKGVMQTNNVSSQSTNAAATTPASAAGQLNSNDFLKLLVTQLQNQDP